MRTASTTAAVFLFCAAIAAAQDPIAIDQTVARDILQGAAHSYTIELRAGDYVAGSIEQQGMAVFAAVFLPDGSRLRGLSGPREGKRDLAFIAETSGTYRLELRGATAAEMVQGGMPPVDQGKYTLKLTEKLSLDDRLKPAPRQDKYLSPTIEALRKQLAHGETTTDRFWQERSTTGTPVIEPVDSDSQRTLVTFLWRGTPDTRNVVVLGSFGGRPIAESGMTQLQGSDVWYLTVRVPSGARFAYSLSVNDPLTFDPPRASQRSATLQADPLNPNRWGCQPTASRYECQSMVELPGAPPQPWILRRADTPSGTVDKHRIKSELLKNSAASPSTRRPIIGQAGRRMPCSCCLTKAPISMRCRRR